MFLIRNYKERIENLTIRIVNIVIIYRQLNFIFQLNLNEYF